MTEIQVNEMDDMRQRLTVLEVEVSALKSMTKEHIDQTRSENQSLGVKLDSLLEIKNKGVGAFWLASALMGSGIIGMIVAVVQWVKT